MIFYKIDLMSLYGFHGCLNAIYGHQYEPFEEVKDAVWEHHVVYFRNVLIYS